MPRFLVPFIALCFAVLAPALASADASPSKEPPPPVGWPEILRDNSHSSVSPDVRITASNAATLGLHWMSAMRNADIGSPVSVYSSALGRTVVYIGDERGDVIAFDQATGATLWSTSVGVGNAVRPSPLVAPDGSVWVGTAGTPIIAKLDGSTGQVLCSVKASHNLNASLMYASPSGGVPTVYTATNHDAVSSGPELAINESNCSIEWSFDNWLTLSGVWATAAYAVDANGNSRVYMGTADPDSTMYALDALTGKEIWNYSALNPPDGTFDIGAAATISAPGNNGFKDGVLYFPSKYGVLYALDLTTGKLIWQYNFNKAAKVTEGGRSSASLYKTTLVYGMANGVEAVNALTGALLWHYTDPSKQEVISSPVVAGPSGEEIVATADVTGLVQVLRLSDGKLLYKYQTGNYVTSSPAVINGNILIDSSDGFLYDFTVGGYNVASPSTTITSPTSGSNAQRSGSNVTITGTAKSNSGNGVSQVQLAVQRAGAAGPWYNAASGMWSSGATNNLVNVASPGQQSSTWTFSLPVPPAGSTYQVTANAVDAHNQVDRVGAQSSFTVLPTKNSPQLTLSASILAPAQSFVVSGGPFSPNETVDFVLQQVTIGKATAGSNGLVAKTTLKIPAKELFGPSALIATGEKSNKSTTAAIDITNVWNQLGYDATHSGYEPNDDVIGSTLQSTHNGYLSVAWKFASGAPIEASPAVVNGVAYVANTSGTISAVDTVSGAAVWTHTIESGAAIHSSPAVGNGDVVFGSDDGVLHRLASATGAVIGTLALDGVPTSPALVGGTIYVGTDNGTVYAIDEATGKQTWSTSVGAAIHTAPSVDMTGGVLVVGDDSGNVTTLNPATGAQVGQVAVGSTVTTSPAISGGRVFVGFSNGRLETFAETTRKLDWKYSTGSPVSALSALTSDVYVGTNSGTMLKLDAVQGNIIYEQLKFGSAVVGIGRSTSVSLTETAKGDVNVLKDDQNGRIQYDYVTGAALDTQPAVVDGAVYVGSEDGNLIVFTTHGQAPQGAVEHQMLLELRKTATVPAAWAHPAVARRASVATRAFAPYGRRDFALHLDRNPAPASVTLRAASAGIARTYLIGWSPVAVRAAAYVERARASSGPAAGSAVDTAPYPHRFDDAAVQREIAREIQLNGWHPDASSRFLMLTASAPVSPIVYCEYHSAFYLDGNIAAPVIYGVVPAGTTEECGPLGPQLGREWKELDVDPFARS